MRKDRRLSPEEKRDAVAALRIVEPYRMTLESAARLATGSDSPVPHVRLVDAVDRYLSDCRERLREATMRQYEGDLFRLLDTFPEAGVSDLTRDRLERFLETVPGRAGMFRSLRAFLRWASKQNPPMIRPDPTREMAPPREAKRGEIQFLTPKEVRGALPNCGKYRAALALALFAGIRTEEIAGVGKPPLLWRHVRVADRIIRIPAEIAKTGRSRILEGLPPNLWTWLEPEEDSVRVCPGLAIEAIRRFQVEAGYRESRSGATLKPWPVNALRHTFATYAVAHFGDANRVSLLLGHEGRTSLVFRNYRGMATKAQAKSFFAVRFGKI